MIFVVGVFVDCHIGQVFQTWIDERKMGQAQVKSRKIKP
jgi:hypothetical protein